MKATATSAWTSRSPACSPGHGGARDLPEGRWLLRHASRSEVEASGNGKRAILLTTGEDISIGAIEKMSKSKRNTVDPTTSSRTYGADVARWFMLSDSPPDRDVIWSDERVQARRASCTRLWRLVNESAELAKAAPSPRPARSATTRWACARPPWRAG